MTDHDTQDVTGCGGCPYAHQGGNGGPGDAPWWANCEHPTLFPNGRDIRDHVEHLEAPDWCPLRVRPVLVRLVVKESQ